jgi:hypothetical protein
MSRSQSEGDRTRNKRFTYDVSADELIVGDRVDMRLVAETFEQLGEQKQLMYLGDVSEKPKTKMVRITVVEERSDIHYTLLADPETGTLIHGSCPNYQSVWANEEADWTIYDIGTTVRVYEVHDLTAIERDDEPEDEKRYVQHWVDVVIEDVANGYDDYSGEVETINMKKLD